MSFNCRVCKAKLVTTSALDEDSGSFVIVSTLCGHLFHDKCLEASLTNQKLVHAREGTGPFSKKCPDCERELNGVIEIRNQVPFDSDSTTEEEDDKEVELKLLKKIQTLTTEKERLRNDLEKVKRESENYQEALDEIKIECEEIRSVLVDDSMMRKGDRVFWIMKEGTYAPGKILEMRKKSGPLNESPYSVIKLDRKTKIPGQGPERETAIVPVNELITFKAFFKEFFEVFRHKVGKILSDVNQGMTLDGRQRLLRSRFRESSLRLSIDSSTPYRKEETDSLSSYSHQTVDFIPLDLLNSYKSERDSFRLKQARGINRSKSVQFGAIKPKPKYIEKYRCSSWNKSPPVVSETCEISFLSNEDDSSVLGFDTSGIEQSPISSPNPHKQDLGGNAEEISDEYISVGERVIWYDSNSEHPQIGVVASVLQFTPCAIIKFDKLPDENQTYQFRTVPLEQLFPFALASSEEKLRIAEAYGTMEEFMESHEEIFEEDGCDYYGIIDELKEEYFSSTDNN